MSFAHSQTCYSSIFVKITGCPDLGRSCLHASGLRECFSTRLFSEERGDPTPIWHKDCLPSCSFLNWYWRAARRPLVFVKLDFPPRPGKRPPVLERASCKSSFLHSKHKDSYKNLFCAPFPAPPPPAISACSEVQLASYCPSLLQLQPSLIKLIPSTRNSVPERGFMLSAYISDVSAAHNYGSLLFPLHLFLKK